MPSSNLSKAAQEILSDDLSIVRVDAAKEQISLVEKRREKEYNLKRRRIFKVVIAALILTFASVGIVLLTSVSNDDSTSNNGDNNNNDDNNNSNNNPNNDKQDKNTAFPSDLPTHSPALSSSPTPASSTSKYPSQSPSLFGSSQPTSQWYAAMSSIISPHVLSQDKIHDSSTPQGLAFDWIVETDNWTRDVFGETSTILLNLGSDDHNLIVQRYICSLIYFSSNGDGWTNSSNWLTDINVCKWYGVSCKKQIVNDLALNENSLKKQIPSEIYELTRLSNLNLHSNSLTGLIPSTIGLITSLSNLTLHHNNFDYQIFPEEICLLKTSNSGFVDLTADCSDSDSIVCDCCTACY